MSMRAWIVLISLFALGHAEALATAPQIVDPREDLFEPSPTIAATKPNLAIPSQPDRNPPAAPESSAATKPDAHAAQPPATSAAKREMPANPLWAIPLSQLTATRLRPIFSPSRRPPQPVAVIKPIVPAALPPKPSGPATPQLSLVGTIVGTRGGIGLFINAADKSTIRLKLGENHKGWVLRAIASHQAELANGLDNAVLKLPPPDMKAVVGAPPPPYPVAASQGMPMPSPPVNASQPANTALPADPAGGQRAANIAIRPPALDLPQPVVNPFRSPIQEKGVTR